jgi:predicted dehydrogenase
VAREATDRRLGVGFVGSGFNALFHMRGWVGVREADIRGVWSPNHANAESAAAYARDLDVGNARPYGSIAEMIADPAIDTIWLAGPNHSRIENVEEIVAAVESGRGELRGLACEKPLARNVAEAKRVVELAERAGLATGYLENQVFAPALERGHALLWTRGAAATGRPYLARAAEEHAGPHEPWFWQGRLQGGGVLNDMMCHSALVVRSLLAEPGAPLTSLRLLRVTGHIASLKWTRPEYAERLAEAMRGVDYRREPAEDYASVVLEFEDADGRPAIGEATTSWSFVGAGLRLSAELLGPEYSMSWNSLDTGLNLFFSRAVRARGTHEVGRGEDLVEKQNAEIGLMPVVADEAVTYGYQAEDRHFARAFLGLESPRLTFQDGLEVVEILMTAYKSAEEGRTLDFPPLDLETFVPAVARGTWNPAVSRTGNEGVADG